MSKRLSFWVITIVFGLGLPFIVLETALRLFPVSDALYSLPVNENNPVRRFTPNRDVVITQGWNFEIHARKHVNNHGFLNHQDYDAADKRPLLAVIGDSFVEAVQVNDRDTLQGILAEKVGDERRVYSFAASGTPLAGYLAYAAYARRNFHPGAMVFVIVGNDFDESLQKYQPNPGQYYFTRLSGDEAGMEYNTYEPSKTRVLLSHSAIFRYFYLTAGFNKSPLFASLFGSQPANNARFVGNVAADYSDEKLKDSMWAVDAFFRRLQTETGLPPGRILFVVDGARPNLYDTQMLLDVENSFFGKMRNYFLRRAASLGYETLDMQPVFRKHYEQYGQRFEFRIDGHWNALGHALAAREIMNSRTYQQAFPATQPPIASNHHFSVPPTVNAVVEGRRNDSHK